jgi:recombination protein RecR
MSLNSYPESIKKLIEQFSKFPGIGKKTAQRLAFFILKWSNEEVKKTVEACVQVKKNVRFCSVCNNLSDRDTCEICIDSSREKNTICVVEQPNDISAIDKMGIYRGAYHVLLGALSPLDGIGPKDLKISDLVHRVKDNNIKELIIATNSNTEGEATALYIKKIFKPIDIKISRLASGMPVGASVEHADHATLQKAFEQRVAQ